MQEADVSCHTTVETWILNPRDFCLFLSAGRLLWLEPHPRARSSGTRLCWQPSAAAQGCASPGTAACEAVGWGCQHLAKYSPVPMETGSPHPKFQCSRCSRLTGLMGDEKLMFDLHAVLWDPSPCPSAGVAHVPVVAEHDARTAAPLVPAAGCCGACAAMLCHGVEVSPGVSAGEAQNHPSRDGATGVFLEMWGWLLLLPLLPGRISTGCQPGRLTVLATVDWHYD